LKLRLVEKAVPRLREMVVKRFTRPTAAMQIARLAGPEQEKVLDRVGSGGFSVRDVKRMVDAVELAGSVEEKERVLGLDRRLLAEMEEDLRVREAMKVLAVCETCGATFPALTLWNVKMCINCRIFFDRLFDKLTAVLGKPREKVTRHDVERVEFSLKPLEA